MASIQHFLEIYWYILLGFILALYVMLDGFDLGVGIISLFSKSASRRSLMMASLSSVWDANEVWLIIWGGALFGAFPLAYSASLNAFYVPITFLLIALIFRGISFEFHSYASNKNFWNFAFGAGSLVAAIAQGCILGGALSGISLNQEGDFIGSPLGWIQPLTIIVVVEVISGYCMLGSTYLVMKTSGASQQSFIRYSLIGAIVTLILAFTTVLLLIYKIFPKNAFISASTVNNSMLLFSFSGLFFIFLIVSLLRRYDHIPFFLSLLIFLITFGGLWYAAYPYLLPGAITIQRAAASAKTLLFMLIGISPILPLVLIYNGYLYLVFRGKIDNRLKDGYDDSDKNYYNV